MIYILQFLALCFFTIMIFPAQHNDRSVSGLTEVRNKIVIVDTGLSREQLNSKFVCKDVPFLSASDSPIDMHGHGTNIFGLIAERIDNKKYCITMANVGFPIESVDYLSVLRQVSHLNNVVGINLSIDGTENPNFSYLDIGELTFLKGYDKDGIKIIVAAGNKGKRLNENCKIYPACHKRRIPNMIVVGNTGNHSNYGPMVNVVIDGNKKGNPVMSGSSQSTAIYTGMTFSK